MYSVTGHLRSAFRSSGIYRDRRTEGAQAQLAGCVVMVQGSCLLRLLLRDLCVCGGRGEAEVRRAGRRGSFLQSCFTLDEQSRLRLQGRALFFAFEMN